MKAEYPYFTDQKFFTPHTSFLPLFLRLRIVQNTIFAAPGPAPECLEGDRVDGSLVVTAEPLRVKLVGLRPVGGVQVEADLGSEDV